MYSRNNYISFCGDKPTKQKPHLKGKTLKELQVLANSVGIKKKSTKKVICEQLLKEKKNNNKNKNKIEKKNNRSTRGNVSEKQLVNEINNNTGLGKLIRQKLESKDYANKKISKMEVIGGRGSHVDMIAYFTDGTFSNIELKTTKQNIKNKPPKPWIGNQLVQTNSHFTIRKLYVNDWYDEMIKSKLLTRLLKLKSPIPSRKDWLKYDANQGDTKTLFGLELKQKCTSSNESIKIMKQIKNEFVVKFRNKLNKNKYILRQLFNEFKQLTSNVLNQKQFYIYIDNFDEFKNQKPNYVKNINFYVYNQIKFPSDITPDSLSINTKSVDLEYIFHDRLFEKLTIRWQNRIGIANVSVKIV